MITDYIPKRHYPKTYVVFHWGLRLATVVVLVGLYEFQVNDVGMFTIRSLGLTSRDRGGSEEGVDCLISVVWFNLFIC